MRNRVGVILALAVVSGILAAFLAFRFLRRPNIATPVEAAEVTGLDVLVAARDLPAGHLLAPEDVRAIPWPADNVPVGFARDPSEVVGRGLLSSIRQNETILASKIASPESGNGLQLTIPSGMRAVAVRVNEVIAVGGWVHPGMRIDVLVTLDQGAEIDEPTTQTVLQDIEILRLGQLQKTNDQNEAVMVTVATLLVSPDEAQKLTLMETKGQIRLILRNPLDRDTVDLQGIRAAELITGRRRVNTGGRRASPRPVRRTIEVIRGTESETVDANGNGGSGGGR